jgi:1-deoxy-D-xylulose-5-phosphate reductoisomerase
MMSDSRRVTILGSTGSIGRQTLEVLGRLEGFRVVGLGAGNNWRALADQALAGSCEAVALADAGPADDLRAAVGGDCRVLTGPGAMTELIGVTSPDVVIAAVVGSAGLEPTLAAIEAGCTVGLANKEALVCAGAIVVPVAADHGATLVPVDSEHSGIFQCLSAGRSEDVRRVVITSSGGALRDWDEDEARHATVADALSHPTWQMGRKITIDSATLMNKALEVIEAHWLFDLPADAIDVVIHPQSIVHAMVEFHDGSVIAQLARPDMKGPIAFALTFPDRPPPCMERLDLAEVGSLEFRPLRGSAARAVALAREVIDRGGGAGAVLNAANEAAVQAFLDGRIAFGQIVPLVEQVLHRYCSDGTDEKNRPADGDNVVSLRALLAADRWARGEMARLI